MIPYAIARKALFALDAEAAHGASIAALKLGLAGSCRPAADPRLKQNLFGLDFPNPLGMAAGYDKNGEVPDALLALGFGFTEVGTVTPLPQAGNPRPRIFRLVEDRAVINRLGFNNAGHDALLARLRARRGRGGIVGVNVGANKESADRSGDYVMGISRFAPFASYFTVNISSPNTPGLRDLQARAALAELLGRVMAARDAAAATQGRSVPVLLKIAPDMADEGLSDIAEEVLAHKVDGLIVSNTTLSRAGLTSTHKGETGGMSGRPLFELSTRVLARMHQLTGGQVPLIGVGGIDSAETAYAKIAAGASLVQLYSGLVYEGPPLVQRILSGLSQMLARDGLASIAALAARDRARWL